jgi:molecular chaperone GrpE
MQTQTAPKVPRWPFFLGDAFFLGAAYFIYLQTRFPMGAWQLFFIVICAAGGAILAVTPFLLEYRLLVKLAEAQTLTSVTGQLQNLQQIASQIGAIQEYADKSASHAKHISDRLAGEAKAFNESLRRANDNEKASLQQELDKLRRGEADSLQVLVRLMDHIYALQLGAIRSGKVTIIEQITRFQSACHDTVRRVGLVPFVAAADEPFDPQRHQLVDVEAKPGPNAVISETIASGYNVQGKLLRPALVRVRENGAGSSAKVDAEANQSQLPLESAA